VLWQRQGAHGETTYSPHSQEAKEKEEGEGPHNTLPGHTPNDLATTAWLLAQLSVSNNHQGPINLPVTSATGFCYFCCFHNCQH
jgi:hypothetical protein